MAMAFHLGYVADSDEEGNPTPKKRRCDAQDGTLQSSTKGPLKRRQTLLAFSKKASQCSTVQPGSPKDSPQPVPEASAVSEAPETGVQTSEPTERSVGYTLRDLRRVVASSLRRYGPLLHPEELQALRAFETLSLPAQQLYARLLSRKWPQWVSCQGLGARYKELGEAAAKEAAAELADPKSSGSSTPSGQQNTDGNWGSLLDNLEASAPSETSPWLLDSSTETAASLLQRPLSQTNCQEDSYGKLLLSALPVAELRRMGRGLGLAEGKRGKGGKGHLVEQVCTAATKQRLLQTSAAMKTEAVEALVCQALHLGRWLCCADTWGRRALVLLGELFRVESCGAAEVSFVLFTTKWPDFCFQEARPLFTDRESLDNFLRARAMLAGEDFQRYNLESAEGDAALAEEGLRKASSVANGFEAAKLQDPFRRRFTAAWCYAEALHHAVTNSPAVGHDPELQAAKIRRLELLLSTKLCTSKRGRWYAELAKEVSRIKGPKAALEIAAEGLAEGMDLAPLSATVDLTSEMASQEESKEENFAPLPRDARWDLARRCRTLAKGVAKAKNAWKLQIQKTQAAQKDGDGKWLSELVVRLIEEEDNATGPVRNLTAATLGLPQVAPAESNGTGVGRRRMFDGFRLEELTVEELAMQHYLLTEGGNFHCGIHCEGAILRDLFGLLLFDQMFECSVEGAFVSAFQDAPLDLGTEAFYPSRSTAIEKRLAELTSMTPGEVAEEVRRNFQRLHGWRIRGLRWDRYDEEGRFLQSSKDTSEKADSESSAEDAAKTGNGRRVLWTNVGIDVTSEDRQLAAAAGAIGGRALAASFRLLCQDYNSAGLPDLLLWSWNSTSPRARFVEVKSERDTLARRQRLWLSTLRAAGAEAEVCHVRDGPVEELFQSKLRRKKRAASDGSSEGF